VDISHEKELLFLIDTGADISLLKGEKLIDTTDFDPKRKVKGKCVDGSPLETHAVVETKIGLGSNLIPHNFQLVSKQVGISCDGILSQDFFQIAKATICYASRTVILQGERYSMVGQVQKRDQIKRPPRTESVVRVPVKPGSPSIGITNKCKLQEGVFMAASLTNMSDGYIFTSILNTNEMETMIQEPLVELEEINFVENQNHATWSDPQDREVEISKQLRMDHLN
jgi:hypothetical protein